MRVKRTIKYFVIWPLITLLILVVALRLSLLPLVEMGVNHWFERQDIESSIDDMTIDVSDAKFSISGLKAQANGSQVLSLDHVAIEWSWSALLENEVDLVSVAIEGVTFDIDSDANGKMVIAGIDIAKLSESDEADLETTTSSKDEPLELSIRLQQFQLSNLKVCYRALPAHDYCNRFERLDWDGLLSLDLAGLAEPALPLQADGNLTLTEVRLHNNRLDRDLLGFKNFSIEDLRIDTLDIISIESILLEELVLLERSADASIPQVTKLEKLQVIKLKLDALRSLNINEIKLFEHEALLVTRADKQMEINEWLIDTASSEKVSDNDEKAEQASEPFEFAIDKLSYQTGKSIQYQDNSSDLSLAVDFNTIELVLQDLDSKKPDQDSKVSFSAKYGKNGLISLKGTARPMMEKQSFNLAGKIEALDLRSLSVFTREAIGHTIKTGQLDADIKLVANNSLLDSQIDITLQHFDIEAASVEDQEKIDAQLGFPLNTSLSLIKDKNNRISLSNSITGDLDSPEFELNTIIVRAITTAFTETILSFYTGFGLISLDDGKLSLGASLKFKPVAFDTGSDDMTEAGTASLEKMAELMNERPNLYVTLCAFTNTGDRIKLVPRTAKTDIAKLKLTNRQLALLDKLGKSREARVKEFLVERKIAPNRLVDCYARHEEGEGLAGVDISI